MARTERTAARCVEQPSALSGVNGMIAAGLKGPSLSQVSEDRQTGRQTKDTWATPNKAALMNPLEQNTQSPPHSSVYTDSECVHGSADGRTDGRTVHL